MSDESSFGDGRNGGTLLGYARWWFASAGVLLLLPRQWFAAGGAFVIAGALALLHRRHRHPPDPPPRAPSGDATEEAPGSTG